MRGVKMKIPKPIEAFIKATNQHNIDEFLAVIAETAVVFDEGHYYRGIAEIKKWSEEKVMAAKVTLQAFKVDQGPGKTIITFIIDGDFDKTGLPDPFKMDFHFTLTANKISELNIQFPEPAVNFLKALSCWVI
jgi:SnoaL-like domain